MTNIESEKLLINNSSKNLYLFLSNFNNFQKLMPEQIINWQSTEDVCSFTIKGMIDMGMRIKEKYPYTKIVIVPNGKVAFDFELICLLEDNTNNKTYAQLVFKAAINPMMMMTAKPLQNFVNLLVQKLKELFETNIHA